MRVVMMVATMAQKKVALMVETSAAMTVLDKSIYLTKLYSCHKKH